MPLISKLKRLPPQQRTRKLYKIFWDADAHCNTGDMPKREDLWLLELASYAELLSEDLFLTEDERALCKKAQSQLMQAWEEGGKALPRRPINNIRHMLAKKVGKISADWDFLENKDTGSPRIKKTFPGLQLYLEDIRSPFNVGSIFRTAESFGVSKIILSPLCASPHHARAKRSAMGCIDLLSWEERPLNEVDGPLFVLETGGQDIEDFSFPDTGTMLIGSEELGASHEALQRAEESLGRLSIPMYGQKASLNASVACGIALYAWTQKLPSRLKP